MADALEDEWWLEENDEKEQKGQKRKRKSKTSQERTSNDKKDGKKKRKKPKVEDITTELDGKDVQKELWKTFCDGFSGSLSNLELEELEIDDSCCLLDDSLHNGNLYQFQPYLHEVIPNWTKLVQKLDKQNVKASPVLVVFSSAATRAVELNRSVADFKGKCRTAKLFAKHMKVEEQETLLESHVIHFGIGTPSRILKLLQRDSLKTNHLKYAILDWTWRDQKLRRMVDIPEVRRELFSVLKDYVFPLAKAKKLKIGLF